MRRENWKGDYIDTIGRLKAKLDHATAARDEARLALGYARTRVAEMEAERDTARDTACRLSEIAIAALAFIDALPCPQVMTAEQQEAWDRLQALR